MSRDLQSYARSGAWSIVAQGLQVAGALVLSIVVVRALSTEQIGVLSLARQLTSMITVVGGLALERVLLRFVPLLVAESGAPAAVSLVLRTAALRLLGWLPFVAAVWWGGDLLDRFFDVEVAGPARVGVLTALLFSMHNHFRAAATARFATATVALGSACGSLLTLGITVWLLLRGAGVEGVLWGAGVGVALGSLPLLRPALRRTGGGQLESVEGSAAGLSLTDRRFTSYALPFFGIAVLNYAVHSQTEVFFLGHWWGAETAGFFHHGFTFAQRLIDFLPLALWEVSMAGFSRIATRDVEALGPALRSYLVLLYLAIVPLTLFGIAFSGSAIELLYGAKMLPSVIVSQAYFGIAAIAAFGAPVGMILYAREKVGAALGAYVVFAAVNVGLDLLLIPRLGIPGALLGLGAAKILAVLLMTRLAERESGRLPVPWAFLGRVTAASAPALLWLLVAQPGRSPVEVAGGLALCVVLVLAAFRVLRVVGSEEARLIRDTRLPFGGMALVVLGHRPEVGGEES